MHTNSYWIKLFNENIHCFLLQKLEPVFFIRKCASYGLHFIRIGHSALMYIKPVYRYSLCFHGHALSLPVVKSLEQCISKD